MELPSQKFSWSEKSMAKGIPGGKIYVLDKMQAICLRDPQLDIQGVVDWINTRSKKKIEEFIYD